VKPQLEWQKGQAFVFDIMQTFVLSQHEITA